MKYKYLGKTGLLVSEIGFGTMTFGKEADEKASAEIYHACREAGINLFDCADMYVDGESENILGRLIKNEREEIILTTKAYFPVGDSINNKGLSRRHIKNSVEKSLKRLNTDYIDIFFFHHFDPFADLEDSLRAVDDLIREGKIHYLGASNFSAWQMMKALNISEREHLNKFACIQPMYNLLKRQAEVEIFPMAQDQDLGVLIFSPLGAGLLTGKYRDQELLEDSRLLVSQKYQERYKRLAIKDVVEKFITFAKSRGYDPIALAIAWAMSHPAVTAPLLGARSIEQLRPALKAVELGIDVKLRDEISALSIDPGHALDRDEEAI